MPISHYSSGKYGESSSSTNNGNSNSYYSRSRDSASERGRERDKDWGSSSSSRGREWRRERDRSRERDRDKERQRSPSRTSRFTADYNNSNSSRDRERRQQEKYYSSAASARSPPGPEDPVPRRVSRFGTAGGKYSESRSGYSAQPTSSYSTTSTAGTTPSLIREKDLLQNPGLTNSILHGNQYGSYHFSSQSHFSDFPSYSSLDQRSSSHQDKNPKDDPLFKAAVDALIMNMKTRGDYDQVRKECFSDIDTKAAFINLHARIKSTVDKYLGLQTFTKDMDKVKTREGMRKKILDTPYFEKGIESVVNQILTPKINSLIRPKVEEEVFKYLKVDRNGEDKDLQSQLTNEPKSENHTKHESIETREIMLPNSPIYKDVNDRPKRLLSKEIGMNEGSEDTMSSPSTHHHDNPPYRVAPPMENSNLTRADSDMSESLSEKSLEIDLDARSEVMDESSGTTRHEEEGPRTPPEPEPATPDTQARPPPPPPPPITTSSSALANVTHSMPNMSIAPPYGAFAGHIPHFGMGVHPSAHGIMEHSLSLGSMTHTTGIPPPLPPLPPSSGEHLPPPPPSPPKPQVPPPPPPPMCDDDACSSPPGGSRMLISNNDEEDEPLPPGEEPDSYFSQMRASKISPPKYEDKPDMPPPPPPEPVEVDLADIKLPGEDSEETTETEEEVEEEDSEEESPMFEKIEEVSPPRVVMDSEEEESPMFEKICEVSPPRPVELHSALVQELTKEFLGEEVDTNGNEEEGQKREAGPTTSTVPERRSSNSSSCSSNECKYLESIPEFDYKVLFYKRIPDS